MPPEMLLWEKVPHGRHRIRPDYRPELLLLIGAHISRCIEAAEAAHQHVAAGNKAYGHATRNHYRAAAKYLTSMATEILSPYRECELAYAAQRFERLIIAASEGWSPALGVPLPTVSDDTAAIDCSGNPGDGPRPLGSPGESGPDVVDGQGTRPSDDPHHGQHNPPVTGRQGRGEVDRKGAAEGKGGRPTTRAKGRRK